MKAKTYTIYTGKAEDCEFLRDLFEARPNSDFRAIDAVEVREVKDHTGHVDSELVITGYPDPDELQRLEGFALGALCAKTKMRAKRRSRSRRRSRLSGRE